MTATQIKKVACPTCRQPSMFEPSNSFRPFCSERCKKIDLGSWADGSYAIPVQPTTADIDELENALFVEQVTPTRH